MIPLWDVSQPHRGIIRDVTKTGQVVVDATTSGQSFTLSLPNDPLLQATWLNAARTLKGRSVALVFHTVDKPVAPLFVLEPEITLDVTEAAGLLNESGISVRKLGLRRLRSMQPVTEHLVKGSIINAALDELVRHPMASDRQIMSAAMRSRPLAIAQLAHVGGQYTGIERLVEELLPRLRSMLSSWEGANVILEPFLISPVLGLQGRADVVVRRGSTVEVIELKAGKPPSTGRPDHAAQAASYAMLLRTARESVDAITSHLWYVQDANDPLRSVDDIDAYARSIIDARNAIVLTELTLADGNMHVLKVAQKSPGSGSGLSSYDVRDAADLADVLRRLTVIERQAVSEWMRMSANELLATRIGGGSARCAADLWRLTAEQRRDAPSVLCDLTIDLGRSVLESMHLCFHRLPQRMPTAIRQGDMVVLRRVVETEEQSAPSSMVLYKGSVRSIDTNEITISLRNKFADIDVSQTSGWMIEQDVMDQSTRAMSTSVRSLLDAPAERRAMILGLATPTHGPISASFAPALTDVQRSVVERAVAARDLFLIQGPPGSGKTSAVLRAIIQELLRKPHERILAVAFTNRAADEICEVLTSHSVEFLRHGSLEGATGERSIPRLARELPPQELSTLVSTCRVIVSTLASVGSASELWGFGEFSTVVVDEASQIVEPQLVGIMAKCRRSILIGDHCQLPAVISQPAAGLDVRYEGLESICMTNLGTSAFERLVRCAHKRGDTDSVAMLTQQGRMHQDVMRFPSHAFYGGRLECLWEAQKGAAPLPWSSVIDCRVGFIPVEDAEQQRIEATILCDLAASILRHPDVQAPPTIGIITPFRAQNTLVTQMLDALLDEPLREHVSVDTVERFQGSERDVILYGTAVSSPLELEAIRSEVDIDGVIVDRKLNVAITRARQQFVLVGNPKALSASPIYDALMAELPPRSRPS
ncbi:MAG: DEAD/DEAH box helicase [Candidatus Kapabacteria bacterium]|nr:DEAD/DEAH box helicase [Candidatus Kapabacteria bacterium]